MKEEEKEVNFRNLFIPFTNRKAVLFIVLIGFFVYFNSLFNGFALDDTSQIINNTRLHSIQNLPAFFQGSTFNPINDTDKLMGIYYKPIMTTYFSIIYSFFGPNAFYFHFFQVILHIVNSILVYLFFLSFFRRKLSFVLALFFLVHPINAESVAYISASQETLFLFFGMLALVEIVYLKKLRHVSGWVKYSSILVLLLLSLLSKETGILFIILLPFFGYLFSKNKKHPSVALLSFGSYLFLRIFIGKIALHTNNISPISLLPLTERLINVPKILFYPLWTFIVPMNLYTSQTWTIRTINFQNFYAPLFFIALLSSLLLYLGYYIARKRVELFKQYIFLSCWFLMGVGFHLQIIPLDSTVADRWFYLPIIGALGIVGMSFLILENRLADKKILVIVATFVILALFGVRTMYRNSNWQSTKSIVSNDIQFQEDNSYLQNTLALELSKAGELQEAAKRFQLAYSVTPQSAILSNLAITYAKLGDVQGAEATYVRLLKTDERYYTAYVNLTYILVKTNESQKALAISKKGLEFFPDDEKLLILSAFAEYKANHYEEAVELITNANKNAKNNSTREIYKQIINHQPIDEYL